MLYITLRCFFLSIYTSAFFGSNSCMQDGDLDQFNLPRVTRGVGIVQNQTTHISARKSPANSMAAMKWCVALRFCSFKEVLSFRQIVLSLYLKITLLSGNDLFLSWTHTSSCYFEVFGAIMLQTQCFLSGVLFHLI